MQTLSQRTEEAVKEVSVVRPFVAPEEYWVRHNSMIHRNLNDLVAGAGFVFGIDRVFNFSAKRFEKLFQLKVSLRLFVRRHIYVKFAAAQNLIVVRVLNVCSRTFPELFPVDAKVFSPHGQAVTPSFFARSRFDGSTIMEPSEKTMVGILFMPLFIF